MEWSVERTEVFDRWWKKEKVDETNYKYYERALRQFRNIPLPQNQHCFFRNDSFECWETRLPDKARGKGKSGGFRVIFVLDLNEEILLLQGIFRRENLPFKGQRGKHEHTYRDLIKDLARQFSITK